MLKVGLTGGIACGKTYVTNLLRELGCEVIDADQIARAVVEPGQSAYDDIVKAFGPENLQADGTIDRAKLSAIIFADAAQRAKMNAIVHPRIHEAQSQWMDGVAQRNPVAIAVVDAALMIESGGYQRFDTLVVVHCTPEIQLARLMTRNNLPYEEAVKRIGAQMPTSEKLAYANYAIDTSDGFEVTRQQVIALYTELQKQAGLRQGSD